MTGDLSPQTLPDDARLDRDALDAAAALAVAGLVVDLAGAQRQAVQQRRDRIRRRVALVAVAAAVILMSFTLTPGATLVPPLPASVPAGPAGLPRIVEQVPAWIPSAAQDPIGRAVYLLGRNRFAGQASGSPALEPVLVSAEGEYRRVPVSDPAAVALSRDGLRVAWAQDGETETWVRVLDLRSGRIDGEAIRGDFGRGMTVTSLAFSPDGTRVAVGGLERFAGGNGRPGVYLVQAGAGRLSAHCTCGSATDGIAWAADGRLLVDGKADPLRGTGPLPPGTGSGLVDGLELPVEGAPDQPVVSADGRERRELDQVELGPDSHRISLPLNGTGGPVRTADLGTVRQAALLADTGRGILVSRVTQTGADLVLVQPDGTVQPVTAARGGVVVVAVAQDLVADGQPSAAATVPDGWTSPAFYRWQVARAWGARPGLWWTALLLPLLLPGVRRRLLVLVIPLRSVDRLARRSTSPLAGLAVLGLGAFTAGMLIPTEAAPVPAPSGARSPVLPAVLEGRTILPPRAFDQVGEPRTRRISMMFGAVLGGGPRLLGVDADTGTVVRLDDLRGMPPRTAPSTFAAPGGPPGGISPNGRYVALGEVVLDLGTATFRTVAEAGDSTGGSAVTDDGTLLAVVPGSGGRVTIARPGEPGRTLEGSAGTVALEAGADGFVITRLAGASTDRPQDLVGVIDPVGRRYLGRLPGVPPQAVVTVTGGEPGGAAPTAVSVGTADGVVRVGGRAVRAPGSVERLTGGVGGGLVAFGVGGTAAPYAVLRAGPGGPELLPVTRLDWPGVRPQEVALAGGVISQARVLDVEAPRWEDWQRWDRPMMLFGTLLVVWAGTAFSRSRGRQVEGPDVEAPVAV